MLPLAMVIVGSLALGASLSYRLGYITQQRAGWLAVSVPLVPAVRPHLARDGADLTAVVIASVLLFLAVLRAQRTRVAQLSPLWAWQVDRAAGRRALGWQGPVGRPSVSEVGLRSQRLRRWRRAAQ
jgi:hypothetical protein